jgi:hypothetical protein
MKREEKEKLITHTSEKKAKLHLQTKTTKRSKIKANLTS